MSKYIKVERDIGNNGKERSKCKNVQKNKEKARR